jgi:hypothetical protein
MTLSQYEEKIREYDRRMPGFLVPKPRRFITD